MVLILLQHTHFEVDWFLLTRGERLLSSAGRPACEPGQDHLSRVSAGVRLRVRLTSRHVLGSKNVRQTADQPILKACALDADVCELLFLGKCQVTGDLSVMTGRPTEQAETCPQAF